MRVFIDDLRKFPDSFDVVCRTFEEAVEVCENNKVSLISLDHDLGWDSEKDIELKSGYDFVKYFVENNLFAERIAFHTDNVVGFENMQGYLLSAQKHDVISPDIMIDKHKVESKDYFEDGIAY